MVSAAHPLASEIGKQILKQGGNAVDAAVATAFALNVVEPEMSGLGGGGAMLIWMKEDEQAHFIDYYAAKRVETYESKPAKETDENLVSVAIPGTVAGLLHAEETYGKLSRKQVMQPAIDLAKKGFPMYLTLAQFIAEDSVKLAKSDQGAEKYWPEGKPFPVGKRFRQTELAATLQKIADEGVSAFYEGGLAQEMVKTLNEGRNPVTLQDFKNYKIRTDKTPLASTYKNWRVLSAPPPQTGFEILEVLNLLDPFDLSALGLPTESDSTFHVLTTALRVGIADWNAHIDDPGWEEVPAKMLSSKEYAEFYAPEIFANGVPDSIIANDISELSKANNERTVDTENETTHLSVIDEQGNAVALTQTNSSVFGSGGWVAGFFLNNSGIDFAEMEPDTNNDYTSEYRIRPSTISPTIVLNDDGSVKMVIGAPGGGRIPTAVVQNMVYMLDYDMDPMEALRMPRIFPDRSTPFVELEKGFDGEVLEASRERGYKFKALSSGYARIYVIKRDNGTLVGAADPRHEGGVSGY
jgi:gamma-glutamyltranspeptidase/glutathione hydrolase